jgi:hypothetical protein
MKTLKQHAREKLEEANFHLRNLAREEKKVVRNEPEGFKSSLNGFLMQVMPSLVLSQIKQKNLR